jgi:flagellar biosynthesis/type III secretory pathway ATPase
MVSQVSKAVRAVLAGVGALLPRILERAGLRRTRAAPPRRTGFIRGLQVPDDFDEMYADEIQAMFEGHSSGAGR